MSLFFHLILICHCPEYRQILSSMIMVKGRNLTWRSNEYIYMYPCCSSSPWHAWVKTRHNHAMCILPILFPEITLTFYIDKYTSDIYTHAIWKKIDGASFSVSTFPPSTLITPFLRIAFSIPPPLLTCRAFDFFLLPNCSLLMLYIFLVIDWVCSLPVTPLLHKSSIPLLLLFDFHSLFEHFKLF